MNDEGTVPDEEDEPEREDAEETRGKTEKDGSEIPGDDNKGTKALKDDDKGAAQDGGGGDFIGGVKGDEPVASVDSGDVGGVIVAEGTEAAKVDGGEVKAAGDAPPEVVTTEAETEEPREAVAAGELTEEQKEEAEDRETLEAMERVGEAGALSIETITEKDIRDLEKKRDALNVKAEEFKAKRDKLNSKTKSLIQQRDRINDSIRENVRKAADCREERNHLNQEVKEAKVVREQLNKNAAELAENVSRMKKDRLPKDGVNLGRLKKELKDLEFKYQTSVLSSDAERELVDTLKKLKAQINEKEKTLEESTEVKEAISKAKDARAKAEEQHQKVGTLAEKAQEQHNLMVELYEKSDEFRRELDGILDELGQTKTAADEEHKMHIKLIRQVHDYDKIIYGMRRKRRRLKKAKSEASAKMQTKEILEKFRRGEKLSTEDLMALQTKDG